MVEGGFGGVDGEGEDWGARVLATLHLHVRGEMRRWYALAVDSLEEVAVLPVGGKSWVSERDDGSI